MSKSHQRSRMPAQEIVPTIDTNTAALFHYDVSANSIQGHSPKDNLYDDSLVCCLDMQNQNEDGTYVIDKSRYGSHAKIFGPTLTNSRNGKALHFNGSTDYIKITGLPFATMSSCSVSFWLKLDIVKGWSIAKGITIQNKIMVTSDGVANFVHNFIGTFSGTIYLDGIATIAPAADTNWHHYVMSGVNLSTWSALSINAQPGLFLNGILDSFSIYNRALSQGEVIALYNQSIYSLRLEGKYGGCIAIEEGTTNFSANNELEKTSTNEYMMYENLSPIFDANGVGTYTFSFDLKSAVEGPVNVYCTDRTNEQIKYIFTPTREVQATTEYKRYSMVVTVASLTPTATHTSLAFYGTYGTGRIPSVKNVQVEKKSFPTSFTNGSRETGKLIYNNPIPYSSSFTFSFWLYLGSAPVLGDSDRILTLNNGSDVNGAYMDVISGTSLRFFTYNSAGAAQVALTTNWERNKWMHISMVRDNTNLIGYVDGVKQCEAANIGILNLNGNLTFGIRNSIINGTNILIDELRIDNIARTADEIQSWYLSGCPFWPVGNERMT